MRINSNNQDLKIIDYNRGYNCFPCAWASTPHVHWCSLFCRSGKVWIEDIFNSDIFKL